MTKFKTSPMYTPAPSVVRNELVRKAIFSKFGNKGLLLIKNNNSFKSKNLFLLNRNFSSSTYLFVDPNLEEGVDPFTTYGESPIPSDVEGSTDKLADKFIGNPSGLIAEQNVKMESVSEKSKIFISELLQDRNSERTNLQPSELEKFDIETRELIKDESNLYKNEVGRIAIVRDDALDLIAGRSRSKNSGYDSDYESDTSINRVQAEYASLDTNTAEIINDHNRFINNTLQSLSYNNPNTNLQTEGDITVGAGYPSVTTSLSDEAGRSNYNMGIKDTSLIRKRSDTDTDEESPAKKVKACNTAMNAESKPDNVPNNSQSPLDYVLEKQQCDPCDIGDDLD